MASQLDAIRALATLLAALRPTWDVTPTANQLLQHKDLPLDQLAAAAIRCAQDPNNRTPAALKWMTPAVAGTGERESGNWTSQGPRCEICGRTRTGCDAARRVDIEWGIEAHHYESQDDALRNKARKQLAGSALAARTSTPEDAA